MKWDSNGRSEQEVLYQQEGIWKEMYTEEKASFVKNFHNEQIDVL